MKKGAPPPSYSAFALYKLADFFDNYYMIVYIFQVCFQSVNSCGNISKPKKSKSEAECGEGSILTSTKNASLIITDFLAMIKGNEQ